MTLNLKVFFAAFLVSLPFWWLANFFQENLEDFFFWNEMAQNPHILLAQVSQEERLQKQKPIRNRLVEEPEIEARAVLSVFVDEGGSARVLFSKNSREELPIASITKLMTALVVLEYYDIGPKESADLLYPMLIASDNDAAVDLAEVMGRDAFLDLMNFEADRMGLNDTRFFNPSGLDPEPAFASDVFTKVNFSTTEDLVKLASHLTEKHPLIWEVSRISAFQGSVNTNNLLDEFPKIIGGKTGRTERAKECLLLVLKPPRGQGQVINVVLGSDDRSEDMKRLINWVSLAYLW